MDCQKDTGANLRSTPSGQSWSNQSHKINNVYYNSKNKINTHTSLKPKIKYTWLKKIKNWIKWTSLFYKNFK